MYVLNEAVESGGNAFLTEKELEAKAAEILGVSDVGGAILTLAQTGRLVLEEATFLGETETAIYTPSLHRTETGPGRAHPEAPRDSPEGRRQRPEVRRVAVCPAG